MDLITYSAIVFRIRLIVAALMLLALASPAPAHAQLLRATQSDSSVYRTGVDDAGARRYAQLLEDVDADAQRVALRWGTIARTCDGHTTAERSNPDLPGCYDWTPIDEAVAMGPIVWFTVREVPCWLHRDCAQVADGGAFVGATAAELERFREELAAFLVAAATRYPTVTHWTAWNEPNGKHFWSESPDGVQPEPPIEERACHFARVHDHVAGVLQGAASGRNLRVGFGPLAPSSSRQPVAYLEAAARCLDTPVDALALHAYPGAFDAHPFDECTSWSAGAPAAKRSLSLQCVEELRRHLDRNADGALERVATAPLWVLETAYEDVAADPERGIDALRQARYYGLALERLAIAGAEILSWYPGVDGSDVGDWQSGLVNSDVRGRRPLALAFQAPLSVRRDEDGIWHAWTPHVDGSDRTILVSEHCDHDRAAPASERYDFEPAQSRERDAGTAAKFDVLADGSCLAVGDGDRPLPGLIIGIRDGEPYLVSARVIDDVALDPWGDVLIEGDGGEPGNPSGAALFRRLLHGSPEPVRIDP